MTAQLSQANMQLALNDSSWGMNFTGYKVMLPPPIDRFGARGAEVSPDPACLDGSAYGFYIHLGSRRDAWIIDIQGGGWAYTLDLVRSRRVPSMRTALRCLEVTRTRRYLPLDTLLGHHKVLNNAGQLSGMAQ
jgi:hypothetical protein